MNFNDDEDEPEISIIGYQPVHVVKTNYDSFKKRPEVKKECSSSCLDAHEGFEEQKSRETQKKKQRNERVKGLMLFP